MMPPWRRIRPASRHCRRYRPADRNHVNPLRALKRRINRLRHAAYVRSSFAQCGEDIIIAYAAQTMGIDQVSYLDIGAHHPIYLSNTYYFYTQGARGVCVEPDRALLAPFAQFRPGDRMVNAGIGSADGSLNFYVLSTPTLNTFSREEAERYVSYGTHRIERTEKVEIIGINRLLREQFDVPPTLLSLDVEGLDLEILRALDFNTHRPPIVCVETLTYTEDGSERKLDEIIQHMLGQDYFSYADTYVNTVFVDRRAWARRKAKAG